MEHLGSLPILSNLIITEFNTSQKLYARRKTKNLSPDFKLTTETIEPAVSVLLMEQISEIITSGLLKERDDIVLIQNSDVFPPNITLNRIISDSIGEKLTEPDYLNPLVATFKNTNFITICLLFRIHFSSFFNNNCIKVAVHHLKSFLKCQTF